jgi:hypothetical protein
VRRALRSAALLLAAAALWSQGAAAAACVSVPGATELTIEQLGTVIFQELTTDRAQGLVTFGGGVCLELGGVEVRVEAETMVVRTPAGATQVEAVGAVIYAEGWRLGAARFEFDSVTVRLTDVTLEGSGVVGLARSMELDLASGGMVAHTLEVLTPSVRLRAETGTFVDGDLLVVADVVASTCDCPPATAPMRVEGRRARLALRAGVLEVDEGVLVLEPLRLHLPAVLRLTEDSLASLEVPLSLGVVSEGARGWVLGLVERNDGGARVGGDVAFGRAADPRWSVALEAEEGASSVRVEARDGALTIASTHRVPLSSGLALVLAQRSEGGVVARRLQDASATLAWGASGRAPGSGAAVDARASLEFAASAQHLGGVDVAHARARGVASLGVSAPASPAGQASVRITAGATRYLGDEARQTWLAIEPHWRRTAGPLTVDVRHVWRTVDGASPFDARIDAVARASLTTVRLTLRAGDAWRTSSALDVRYDWRPAAAAPTGRVGLERLRLSTSLVSAHAGRLGLAWEAAATLEAAGVLDPAPRRDAFVRASLGVTTPERRVEASVAAEYGLGAVDAGMRSLTVAGAAPFTVADGAVFVQPYLALDVWPAISGAGAVRLVGHGLFVLWETCCGLLDVGYRSLADGSVTTRLGFAIDLREPTLAGLR